MNIFSILTRNSEKLSPSKLCDYCKTQLVINFRRNFTNPPRLKYKVVFLGSDNFSIPSLLTLTQLLDPGNVSVVVSNAGNVVGQFAKKNQLQTLTWNEYKTDNFSGDQEFGVVASFGYLIPLKVIQRFPLGILNVHGSLLPRWRGAAPIPHAIMGGDTRTGISIMQIAPHRFDIGPVLYRQEIPLDPHIRRPELITIMADVGAEALERVISDLDHFLKAPIIQNEEDVRLSPKLVPEMALVDWDSKTALEIYNLFRGLYGVYKLKTTFMDKSVDLDEIGLVSVNSGEKDNFKISDKPKVLSVSTNFERFYSSDGQIHYLESEKGLPTSALSGQIIFIKNILLVKCSEEGTNSNSPSFAQYITVKKIKVGSKWMSAKDFQNGFLSKCKQDQRVFSFKNVSPSQNHNVLERQTLIEEKR